MANEWLPPIFTIGRSLTVGAPNLIVNRMVEYPVLSLDNTFGALSDPTRRALLARLVEGEATVSELAAPYPVSLAAVSKHLQVLERAGLIRRRIEGRSHYIALEAAPMIDALAWLAAYREFWDDSLTALTDLLRDQI